MEEVNEIPYEYQVFSLIFKEKGAIQTFKEQLDPEFVGAIHGNTGLYQFYVTLLDFYEKTGLDPIDPIAFKSWLQNETDIAIALGGPGGVSMFLDIVLGLELSSVDSVVQVLRYRGTKRRQIDLLQELQGLVGSKGQKSQEDTQRISSIADKIKSLEHEIGYDPYANVVTGIDIARNAHSLWELPDFLPTQFKGLNQALGYNVNTGGFIKGAVHGILAASGLGKSTFAKSLMLNWVENGYSVLYVNYEEAIAHWERILFTQVIKTNVYSAASRLTSSEKKTLTNIFRKKMSEWGSRFMVKHDPDTPYFDDLEKWLRDLIGRNTIPDVVIIDTIQSMFMKGAAGKPRWGQFEEMMVRLEKLAKDMHTVLIITGQENANRMKEKREVVQQSDAGGSLAIVQKCSVTIHITPKKLISDDDSEDERIMQLQIPKNRITGTTFANDPPLVRYNDDTKTYEDYELVNENNYDTIKSYDLGPFKIVEEHV